MSTLRIFLSVLAIIKTAASTTCYSPVNLTVQHELLSKTIATSQLDCDKKCTETEECSSLVVDRKTDHVVCVFLGKQGPATVCIKPTEEYKKMECVVASGSLFILSDEVRFLLIPSSLCQRLNKIGIPIQAGLVADSSTKKTPAHARLRNRPTVGLNLRATPSTVLSGTKGAGFFLQPLRL
ncbi:hypothetical protein PRIPAC_85706 [Pristionchus pacificus]|uniref:Uncharacterized protein n=1 Tax=Pristionchus pacificus TaxID=54126 RepID=A0A2A6BSE4_PRIPA|nr:hypothetical protein PRIPAC_85706 [Pristionchus pacificus]|eukprot:PDM68805.1 hypothetical protein PRIPAC_47107 [Pristionchus pacificus]